MQLADRRSPQGGDWLSREQLASVTPDGLVNRTVALKPLLAANSREAERLRRPVDAVKIGAISDVGLAVV